MLHQICYLLKFMLHNDCKFECIKVSRAGGRERIGSDGLEFNPAVHSLWGVKGGYRIR